MSFYRQKNMGLVLFDIPSLYKICLGYIRNVILSNFRLPNGSKAYEYQFMDAL